MTSKGAKQELANQSTPKLITPSIEERDISSHPPFTPHLALQKAKTNATPVTSEPKLAMDPVAKEPQVSVTSPGTLATPAKGGFLSQINQRLNTNLHEVGQNQAKFESDVTRAGTVVIKKNGVTKVEMQTVGNKTNFIAQGALDEDGMKMLTQTAALHSEQPGGNKAVTIHIPDNYNIDALSPTKLQEVAGQLLALSRHAKESGLEPKFNQAAQALIDKANPEKKLRSGMAP